MSQSRPSFSIRAPGTVEALARLLGVRSRDLIRIAEIRNRLYSPPKPIQKPGKKVRYVFSARHRLRHVQQRILDRLLRHVGLPDYLMGGVKGRNYQTSAAQHSRQTVLIGQDVDAFYPSISEAHVRFIFQDVLHCPPDVASLLAKLCTKEGCLVQGGVASTHIANLALYRTEPTTALRQVTEKLPELLSVWLWLRADQCSSDTDSSPSARSNSSPRRAAPWSCTT